MLVLLFVSVFKHTSHPCSIAYFRAPSPARRGSLPLEHKPDLFGSLPGRGFHGPQAFSTTSCTSLIRRLNSSSAASRV
jgi:hypothetical protein